MKASVTQYDERHKTEIKTTKTCKLNVSESNITCLNVRKSYKQQNETLNYASKNLQ